MATPRIQKTFGTMLTMAAIVFAVPAGIAVADPGNGNGNGCSASCETGFYGGKGNAKGGLIRFGSEFAPGETVSNSGNEFSGHISITDTWSISGHAHPDGTISGNEKGTFPGP